MGRAGPHVGAPGVPQRQGRGGCHRPPGASVQGRLDNLPNQLSPLCKKDNNHHHAFISRVSFAGTLVC